jgi:hypothetical protein
MRTLEQDKALESWGEVFLTALVADIIFHVGELNSMLVQLHIENDYGGDWFDLEWRGICISKLSYLPNKFNNFKATT